MKKIKCPGCGNLVSAKKDLCPKCGYAIKMMAQYSSTMLAGDTDSNIQKDKKTKYILIAFGVFATIIVFSLAIVQITNNKNERNDKSTEISISDDVMAKYLTVFPLQHNDEEFTIFFSLKSIDGEYLKLPATIQVKIVNSNGESLYFINSSISVDDYEYIEDSGVRLLLASYKIPDKNIKKSDVPNGIFEISIYGSNFSFNAQTLETDELPYNTKETETKPSTSTEGRTEPISETSNSEYYTERKTSEIPSTDETTKTEAVIKEPTTETPTEPTTTHSYINNISYEIIYNNYGSKLRGKVSTLIDEYYIEAQNNQNGINGLAEIYTKKVGVLAEIYSDGVSEMADCLYSSSSGKYSEYEDWAGKLYDIYEECAGRIFDAYLSSAV